MFIKPNGITIVVLKISSKAIDFIHLAGLLLLQQSHITAARGLQKNDVTMISPVDFLLACLKLREWDFWALPCAFGAKVSSVKSKGNTAG